MATVADTLFARIQSHAMASGLFERVNLHEPKHKPGNGLTCAIWMQSLGPARKQSGLDATTVVIHFMVRIYTPMNQEPQDYIDPNLMDAAMRLMNAYSQDFTLGANVRNIDLLGAQGPGLSLQAGYLEIDSAMHRVLDVVLPIVVNDLFGQEA